MNAPLLLSIFPTFAVGGAQSRFTTIANHLGSSWRHAIVAMDGVTTARERFDRGLAVSFPSIHIRKGDLLGNLRRFRGAIGCLAPMTMLTHNFGSIEWALANRISLVNHVHVEDGFGPEERVSQIPRRVWLRRLALSHRSVVLPSQTLLKIAERVWRLNPRNLHYVPNGINLSRFIGPGPQTRLPGLDISTPVVGTVAALRPEKNVGRLIRAFHRATSYSPAQLVVVGDGPQRAELETLTTELGLTERVHFTGHVPRPDELIRTFDIFALSSDTEQMPISLLEAMAAGLPTVATDVGDVGMMLPENGRAFVTPCDDSAFGAALLTLIRQPKLRRELGEAARSKAENCFDESEMFRRWSIMLDGSQSRKQEVT